MPSKSMAIPPEVVQQLRVLFRKEYEQKPPDVPFHPTDIERIEKSDEWLARFLKTHELDVEQSLQKLWETLIWRQTFGANDLSELNLRQDYLKMPIVFAHNYDIDGFPLLICQCRYHTSGSKDMDAFMRVVVYWIERIHRTYNMSKMSLIFDLSETGIKCLDMDFVMRIMNLFKFYYPSAINLIIVYELPWVLNAGFSLIKRLLSANALEVLRVSTKKDITKYINKDNCLVNWGGNDNYKYVFIPEKRQTAGLEEDENKKRNSTNDGAPRLDQNNQSSLENCSKNIDNSMDINAVKDGPKIDDSEEVHFDTEPTNQMENFKNFQDPHSSPEQTMLRINPSELLSFPYGGETSECLLEITSIARSRVTYKIQTTSPEKFRVRPRCGILMPGETISISIFLKPEHKLTESNKDKFLIMGMPLPQDYGMGQQQLSDLWKSKAPLDNDIEQHRLCCQYKSAAGAIAAVSTDIAEPGQQKPLATASFTEDRNYMDLLLTRHQKKFEKQMRRQHVLSFLTLILVILIAMAVGYLVKLEILDKNDERKSMCYSNENSSFGCNAK